MMAQQKPKKQPKPKRLNINAKSIWRQILKEVDKKEVPIHVLERLKIYLKDGTTIEIDIKELTVQGTNLELLEDTINQKLDDLDAYIENVDFFVDLDLVIKTVQPETDRILANL